jgi:hypothetical protein
MRPLLLLLLAAACATSPPPLPTPTGSVHDFDYFEGAWTAHQRRLQTRTPGSSDWEEFPSSLCMRLYLDGLATVDEIAFPTKGWSGLTVRTFDVARRQWSIYWVSSRTGVMGPPQVGGFDGDRGRFYGRDVDDGRPVQVLYEWTKLPPDRARWEQSFSRDGVTWQVNWTADFTRADPSSCPPGRGAPRARSADGS